MYSAKEIFSACVKAVEDTHFRQAVSNLINPYGVGNSGKQIAQALAEVEIGPRLLQKKMTY